MAKRRPLLVVDGYNVLHKTTRYSGLVDHDPQSAALPDVAHLSRDPYGNDGFERARDLLVADVAAYAQHTYDAVVVFDGANNRSSERPEIRQAGIRVLFSARGESADTLIERLVVEARTAGRKVLLVTSDNTIRFTVGGEPIETVSSTLLAQDMELVVKETVIANEERTHQRMTVGDRLSPETREKLRKMMGR